MDVEFHYHLILFLALKAGIDKEDAHTIAYSSQYVDDNSIIYRVITEDGIYRNYISQTLNITRPQRKLLRIYPVFHFMPGIKEEIFKGPPRRRDAKIHLFETHAGNSNSERLVRAAIQSGNLHRIGISLHTYADTFSHQNFVGLLDEFNSRKGIFGRVIPNIGHADFGFSPDRIGLLWRDERLREEFRDVDNRERFTCAALKIFDFLCEFSNKGSEKKGSLEGELKTILSSDKKSRMKLLSGTIPDDLMHYWAHDWFGMALGFSSLSRIMRLLQRLIHRWRLFSFPVPVVAKRGFKSSMWFKFQEAIKEHQRLAMDLLRPLVEILEIKNL